MKTSFVKSRVLPSIFVAGAICGALAWSWNQQSNDAQAAPKTPAAPGAKPKTVAPKAATAQQRKEAIASIRAQLNAFKRGDWKRAITYQSAGLKRNFPSNAAFQQMMETQYPAFLGFQSVQFGSALVLGKSIQVPVKLLNADGSVVSATYLMTKEGGIYRVEGVSGGVAAPLKGDVV
jgi:hypothetical protein